MSRALTFSGTLAALTLVAGAPADQDVHFTSCRTVVTDSGPLYPTGRGIGFVGFTELADGRIALLTREDRVVVIDSSGAPLGSFQVREKSDFAQTSSIVALGTAADPTLVIESYKQGFKFYRPDGTLLRTQIAEGLTVGEPTRFGPGGSAVIVSGESVHIFDRTGDILAREEIPFAIAHDGFATAPGGRIAVVGAFGELLVYRWRRGRLLPVGRTELSGRISEPPAFGRDGTLYVITDHEVWGPRERNPDRYSALWEIRGSTIRSLFFGSTATGPPLPIPSTGEVLVPLHGGLDTYLEFVSFSDRRPWRRYVPDGYVMDPARLTRDGSIYYNATYSDVDLRAPGGHRLGAYDSSGIVTLGPVELDDGRFMVAEIDGAVRFISFDFRCVPRPGANWPYPEI